jgi:hypothetical protein
MKDREATIAFEMNYCQHYAQGDAGSRGTMKCLAGMDIAKIQNVPTGDKGIKWGLWNLRTKNESQHRR